MTAKEAHEKTEQVIREDFDSFLNSFAVAAIEEKIEYAISKGRYCCNICDTLTYRDYYENADMAVGRVCDYFVNKGFTVKYEWDSENNLRCFFTLKW